MAIYKCERKYRDFELDDYEGRIKEKRKKIKEEIDSLDIFQPISGNPNNISNEKLDKFLKDNLKKDVKLLGEANLDFDLDFNTIKQIISNKLTDNLGSFSGDKTIFSYVQSKYYVLNAFSLSTIGTAARKVLNSFNPFKKVPAARGKTAQPIKKQSDKDKDEIEKKLLENEEIQKAKKMSEKIISLRTTLTKKLKDLIKKFKSLTKTTNTHDISIEPIKKLSKIFDIPNDEEHDEDNPEEPPNEDSCSKINGWNDVSLAVCIIKSLDVLKKYMDSHIDNYIKTTNVARGIELFEGAYVLRSNIYKDWKSWNFLKNDYGIYYDDDDTLADDTLANKIIKGDSRMNTTYNSIPEKLIYNFKLDNLISNYTSKDHFPPDVNNFLHTYDTNLGLLDETSVFEPVQVTLSAGAGGGAQQPTIITKNVFTLINNNKRWIRLPCFTIFNQLSIFKGNADIAQEFTTLIKFGGIYQNNEIQSVSVFMSYYSFRFELKSTIIKFCCNLVCRSV